MYHRELFYVIDCPFINNFKFFFVHTFVSTFPLLSLCVYQHFSPNIHILQMKCVLMFTPCVFCTNKYPLFRSFFQIYNQCLICWCVNLNSSFLLSSFWHPFFAILFSFYFRILLQFLILFSPLFSFLSLFFNSSPLSFSFCNSSFSLFLPIQNIWLWYHL